MWIPERLDPTGPRYLAIVRALETDIETGAAPVGLPLAPQRELAYRLGISVGTVVRAYAIAQQRGLTSAAVGRGTFVANPAALSGMRHFGDGSAPSAKAGPDSIDLSVNVPPLGRQAERFGQALNTLASSGELPVLMRYGSHVGAPPHREAMAQWIAETTAGQFRPDPALIALCAGAQQAIWAVCTAIDARGTTILTEDVTYPGIKSVAGILGSTIEGVAMDRDGLDPAALDETCGRTGARLLYVMPTLQNPTGATMPDARRHQIVEVARRHDLMVLEDDVYGFLHRSAPSPLAALAPERTCYISGLSKSVAPGLRLGFCAVPASVLPRIEAALRACNWMSSPFVAEIASRWARDGILAGIVEERRRESEVRFQVAQEVLGAEYQDIDWEQARFHLWIPADSQDAARAVHDQARKSGILLIPPESIVAGQTAAAGNRICLGSAPSIATLRVALERLRHAIPAAGVLGEAGTDPYLSNI